jgi:hypothetical protein
MFIKGAASDSGKMGDRQIGPGTSLSRLSMNSLLLLCYTLGMDKPDFRPGSMSHSQLAHRVAPLPKAIMLPPKGYTCADSLRLLPYETR